MLAAIVVLAVPTAQDAWGASSDRSGKAVVEAVCVACHGTGKDGAPRIGDVNAWSKRASQGLTALTSHAIQGIRQMPAHGGSPSVTDFEIERAITYMVNQSGGNWAEPLDKNAPVAERTGEQIVQAQCAKCHQTGVNGAPRIGDKSAWIPRLTQGLDAAVRSAIKGHGGMPPRGGMADLTDPEIRRAVIYMFNPVTLTTVRAPVAPAAVPDAHHKTVGGEEIYLGIVPVGSIRVQGSTAEKAMHGGVPAGRDYYHLNISLIDSKTRAEITDAQVEATVADPVMGGETRKLDVMAVNGTVSYGNYFHMPSKNPYRIEVRIRRPNTSRVIETEFDFRHY